MTTRRSPQMPERLQMNAQKSVFNGALNGRIRSARPVRGGLDPGSPSQSKRVLSASSDLQIVFGREDGNVLPDLAQDQIFIDASGTPIWKTASGSYTRLYSGEIPEIDEFYDYGFNGYTWINFSPFLGVVRRRYASYSGLNIGKNNYAGYGGSTSVGENSLVVGSQSVSLGSELRLGTEDGPNHRTVLIGSNSGAFTFNYNYEGNTVVIGDKNFSIGIREVLIGTEVRSGFSEEYGPGDPLSGSFSTTGYVEQRENTLIGRNIYASSVYEGTVTSISGGPAGISLGSYLVSYGTFNINVGFNNTISGSQSMGIGESVQITDSVESISIGPQSQVSSTTRGVSLGHNARVELSDNSVSIGQGANVTNSADSFSIGRNVSVNGGNNTFGIGSSLNVGGNFSQIFGSEISTSADYSMAYGRYGGLSPAAKYSIMMGYYTNLSNPAALAVGIGEPSAYPQAEQASLFYRTLRVRRPSLDGSGFATIDGYTQPSPSDKTTSLILSDSSGSEWEIKVDSTGAITTTAYAP